MIFGCNIGTTITAQLLAFRLEDVRGLVLLAGLLLCFICAGQKGLAIGRAVFAFGLLFEGIADMGTAMEPLAQSPVFVHWLGRVLQHPWLGLLAGLDTRFTASLQADAVADACYAFLRQAKQGFATVPEDIPDGPAVYFSQMVADYDAETQKQRAAGLLSRDALNTRLRVYAVLRAWEAELRRAKAVSTQPAFDLLRTQFQSLAEERENAQNTASATLEAAFDFMEQAFAESQEMVVFVTELTLSPAAHAFITENGCERYFQYNKDLLLDHRKAALQQELAAEERRHGGI